MQTTSSRVRSATFRTKACLCIFLSALLIFLGYMDTLVHFGHFSLAMLGKAKIDSWLVAN